MVRVTCSRVKKPPIMEMVVQNRRFHFFHFSSSD